jgi:hypothetical protein
VVFVLSILLGAFFSFWGILFVLGSTSFFFVPSFPFRPWKKKAGPSAALRSVSESLRGAAWKTGAGFPDLRKPMEDLRVTRN